MSVLSHIPVDTLEAYLQELAMQRKTTTLQAVPLVVFDHGDSDDKARNNVMVAMNARLQVHGQAHGLDRVIERGTMTPSVWKHGKHHHACLVIDVLQEVPVTAPNVPIYPVELLPHLPAPMGLEQWSAHELSVKDVSHDDREEVVKQALAAMTTNAQEMAQRHGFPYLFERFSSPDIRYDVGEAKYFVVFQRTYFYPGPKVLVVGYKYRPMAMPLVAAQPAAPVQAAARPAGPGWVTRTRTKVTDWWARVKTRARQTRQNAWRRARYVVRRILRQWVTTSIIVVLALLLAVFISDKWFAWL